MSPPMPHYCMGMAPNLIPEDRTDKNGVTSRRWVKPSVDGTPAAVMPRPVSSSSPQAQAKRIGNEVRVILRDSVDEGEVQWWNHADWGYFRALIQDGEVEALITIKRMASEDIATCKPGQIGLVARQLREHGIENASDLINVETIELREKLISAIDSHGRETGEPYLSSHDDAAGVYLMAFTDPDDVAAIADVVKQRGLMPADDLRGLMEQMGKISSPLVDGAI